MYFKLVEQAAGTDEAEYLWDDYRENVTTFVEYMIPENASILVYGGGRMLDISLERLLDRGNYLIIIDKDAKSIQRLNDWAETHHYTQQMECIEMDILNIEEVDQKEFEKNVLMGEELPILELFDRLQLSSFSSIKKCDFSIAIGFHSQLLAPFAGVLTLMQKDGKSLFNDVELQRIMNKMNETNQRLIKEFHSIISESTRVGFVLGCEYAVFYQNEEELLNQLLEYLSNGQMEFVKANNYHRIAGAVEAEQDMASRCQQGVWSLKAMQYLRWPFSKKKQYVMTLYGLDNN